MAFLIQPNPRSEKPLTVATTTRSDGHPLVGVVSREVISYLKFWGSRLSRRPADDSAWGYMRKATGAPVDPGSATSWAKLYAIQFISQDPNRRARARSTIWSSSGRLPGGSSST